MPFCLCLCEHACTQPYCGTNIYIKFDSLQYNTKDSSVRLAYEPQPRPKAIASLAGETITKVACGTNHTGFA